MGESHGREGERERQEVLSTEAGEDCGHGHGREEENLLRTDVRED